jgi:glycosyltransferase involved in cell wall biosynthesis
VTYNQHKYIADCLQSIVDQETDFEFEIIVGDDFSTDGTQEVVRSFGEKYPSLFRLFLQGTSKNELFQAAAYCTKKPPLRRRVVQGRTTN